MQIAATLLRHRGVGVAIYNGAIQPGPATLSGGIMLLRCFVNALSQSSAQGSGAGRYTDHPLAEQANHPEVDRVDRPSRYDQRPANQGKQID